MQKKMDALRKAQIQAHVRAIAALLYEVLPATSETMIRVAMIRLMLRRLA